MSSNVSPDVNETKQTKQMKDMVEVAKEADEVSFEYSKMNRISVSEKVIFCVDGAFVKLQYGEYSMIKRIHTLITHYIEIKRQISAKNVEFGLLIMGPNANAYSPVLNRKDISNALSALKHLDMGEDGPYDFSSMFLDIVETIPLPDNEFYRNDLPPPFVCHFILLIARNKFVPKLLSTNPYYFLIKSPFVNLDILHFRSEDSRKEAIVNAIQCLIPENKGYFFSVRMHDFVHQQACMNKFLGHQSNRFAQRDAKFDLSKLPVQQYK